MISIYGIKNCDSMKKAFKWLDDQGLEYTFHDYKKVGLERALLEAWEAQLGWETLLNRRGMMWRKLPDEAKTNINRETALRLMLETPSMIKRPVLDSDGRLLIGFQPERYAELLS